jgi:hypothetical protein
LVVGAPTTAEQIVNPDPNVPGGAGLNPGVASSVAPRGTPAGPTEPAAGLMPNGEVDPIPGVGLPIPPTWAKTGLQPRNVARVAAMISSRRTVASIVELLTSRSPALEERRSPIRADGLADVARAYAARISHADPCRYPAFECVGVQRLLMRRGDIGGGGGREPGKSRHHDDVGRENDHREKLCHGTSLVGVDLRLTVRITSLLET